MPRMEVPVPKGVQMDLEVGGFIRIHYFSFEMQKSLEAQAWDKVKELIIRFREWTFSHV